LAARLIWCYEESKDKPGDIEVPIDADGKVVPLNDD